MREYIEFDTTPYEEEAAQVGAEDYTERARREGRLLIAQLKRMFPPVEGVRFVVKGNSHDYGTYYEVRLYYTDETEEYASIVESGFPAVWDDEARLELAQSAALFASLRGNRPAGGPPEYGDWSV